MMQAERLMGTLRKLFGSLVHTMAVLSSGYFLSFQFVKANEIMFLEVRLHSLTNELNRELSVGMGRLSHDRQISALVPTTCGHLVPSDYFF